MVDIGFFELLVVAIVALLVLGPERLPIAARTCGLWVSRIRRTVGSIQQEINQELQLDELKQATAAQKTRFKQEFDQARRPFGTDAPAAETGEGNDPASSAQASPNKGTL